MPENVIREPRVIVNDSPAPEPARSLDDTREHHFHFAPRQLKDPQQGELELQFPEVNLVVTNG